jgi:hypothetical protein
LEDDDDDARRDRDASSVYELALDLLVVFGRVYQAGLVRWPWHGRLESGSNGTGARVWQLVTGARLHRDCVWQLLAQIDTVTLASDW